MLKLWDLWKDANLMLRYITYIAQCTGHNLDIFHSNFVSWSERGVGNVGTLPAGGTAYVKISDRGVPRTPGAAQASGDKNPNSGGHFESTVSFWVFSGL